MKMRYLLICLVWLAACTSKPSVPEPTQVAVVEEKMGRETAVTPSPAPTNSPTSTLTPSATPTTQPTETATMTPTPMPTVTPPLMRIVLPSEKEDSEGSGLEFVNQIGGAVTAVAVQDNLAYLGIGLRLAVADISDPENPYVMHWSGILPEVVEQITIDNDLLYVALGESGLWIFDIADPQMIKLTGQVQTTNPARHFVLEKDLAYVANKGYPLNSDQKLSVVDLSDPTNPIEVNTMPLPVQSDEMVVIDNYLYIAFHPHHVDFEDTLWIVDIANPIQPIMVNTIPDLVERGMTLTDKGIVIVPDGYDGEFLLLDVTEPLNPEILPQDTYLADFGHLIESNQNYLFVSSLFGDIGYCGARLYMIDYSQADEFEIINEINLNGCNVNDMEATNDYFYLATDHGLLILDVQESANLSYVGKIPTSPPFKQIDLGNYLFGLGRLGNGYEIFSFDLEHPKQPMFSGKYGAEYLVNDFIASDSQIYLANYWQGIVSIDMETPDDAEITAVNDPEYYAENSYNLVLDKDRLYASLNGNLEVFDPSTLEWLGGDGEDVYGEYGSFDVDETVLWAWKRTNTGSGLFTLDATNSKQIEQISFLAHEGSRLLVDAGFGYTLAGPKCMRYYEVCENPILSIIDGNNPTQLNLLSNTSLSGSVHDMTKTGDTLILFGEEILLVDVSNPAQPKLIGQLELPGYATDAVVRDDSVYVTIGAGGLLVLQMDESP